eukprot:1590218-Alexandrium_andersonii.AAC.1
MELASCVIEDGLAPSREGQPCPGVQGATCGPSGYGGRPVLGPMRPGRPHPRPSAALVHELFGALRF